MAEPAQPEPGAALSPTGIKQEHEITGLEGLDFSLPPELASKRPLGDEGEVEETASKRLKGENIPDNDLEDGLALLVQNALSGVGDLVGDFDGSGTGVGDAMDTDPSSLLDNAVPSSTFYSEPLKYVRGVQTYALANLALTLLYSLVQHQPVDDVLNAIRDKDSEHGKTFRRLKQTLESTWTLFTDNEIISADELQIQGESRTLLDLANLAMLSSWLVEGSSESYSKADSNFLSIFNSSISDLPSGAPDLYLAIKTQKTIEALLVKPVEKDTATLITECMTDGMEEKVRSQHAGQELTAADQAFLTVVRARQDELQTETKEKIDKAALKKKHPADEVLRCIAAYVKTRLAAVSDLGQKYGVPIELVSDTVEPMSFTDGADGTDMDLDDLSSFFERTASGLVQDALAGLGDGDEVPTIHIDGPENEGASGTNGTEKPATNLMTDYKELEALVAESTSNYVKTTLNGLSPVPYQPTVPTSTTESMAAQLPYLAHLQQHQAQHPYYTYTQPMQEQQQPQQPASGENLPPNQTFPSAILYDKARQAALSKSSTHTRREGLHSTRRPWTQEEEKALMAGLDMVKGPHWSQILTLFGQNGTISDILKDRTQVQLKDKARNLKLFFLKTNSEMPYYLQAVTGELKTRAPTQAARKEAEERARLNSEEDQAKLQGIMALAGGLQHLSQNRSSSTSGVGSSVVTPAQAAQSAQSRPGAAATSIPRTVASTMAQNRTGLSASTQQTLQSIQASRSQSQLPPHVPRPQGQQQMSQAQHSQQSQQGQHQQGQPQQAQPRPQSQQGQQQPQQNMQQQQQQQPQQQPLRQPQQQEPQQHPQHPQAAPHAIPPSSIPPRSASNTPTTVPSPAHGHSVPTSQPQTPVTQHTPVTQRTPQPPQASSTGPLPTETPKEVPKPPESITPEEAQEAENAAEAALLEGLQAAVAEALS